MNILSRRRAGAVCGMLVAACTLTACAAPQLPTAPTTASVTPRVAASKQHDRRDGDPIPTPVLRTTTPADAGSAGGPLPAPSVKPTPPPTSSPPPRPHPVRTPRSLPTRDPVKPVG